MRLAAQMRGGYYPAAPEAVVYAASFLRPPQRLPFAVLDPCAGEGAAVRRLSELLGSPPAVTFAIELDDGRAEKLHSTLPNAHVLAPANFFGCQASRNSYSFVWLNPPFDDSYGGRRVESQFLTTATEWLMPSGVIAFICPENVVADNTEARRHFSSYYEKCRIVPFPASCRHYDEVIVLGHKRAKAQASPYASIYWESVLAPEGFVYHIPAGVGPKVFQKVEPTENELQTILAQSPLNSHLTKLPEVPPASPPLALGMGHIALLLASGHLDGVVEPDGQPPHVVRGTARKHEFVSDVTETENDDGSTTKKTTISERIELVVRTVDLTGEIRTFMETEAKEE
jgi:hypothetical protein